MSKFTKTALGIATLWPILYSIGFLVFVFCVIIQDILGGGTDGVTRPIFQYVFVIHLCTIVLMLGLLTFYLQNVFHNEAVPDDKRGLWTVALICGNTVAMPIYWYCYVWRQPSVEANQLESPDSKKGQTEKR